MWYGLAFVTVIGVGLPVCAWWLTGRMAAAKAPYSRRWIDAFGAPLDAIDVWFADHTDLPALRRWKVRKAVLSGRAVNEESLRPVAHELASELLEGQIKSDIGGWSRWALVAAGGSEVIFALAVYLVVGHIVPWIVSPGIYGALALTAGLIYPKVQRHRLTQAMQLNM